MEATEGLNRTWLNDEPYFLKLGPSGFHIPCFKIEIYLTLARLYRIHRSSRPNYKCCSRYYIYKNGASTLAQLLQQLLGSTIERYGIICLAWFRHTTSLGH